jgi:hypothetical protein
MQFYTVFQLRQIKMTILGKRFAILQLPKKSDDENVTPSRSIMSESAWNLQEQMRADKIKDGRWKESDANVLQKEGEVPEWAGNDELNKYTRKKSNGDFAFSFAEVFTKHTESASVAEPTAKSEHKPTKSNK